MACLKYSLRIILLFLTIIVELEGREQRAKAKKVKREEINPLHGMFSLVFVFAALILIPVLIFFYNMMQDPITPTLMKNMTGIIRERTFGFLSTKKNERKIERND
jgi:maltodextrin utilization protein YvdJ|mmetsp:Transcript_8237/g.8229  ORF Transcript_8237/g.8229 Transcript_8237/m.8229 type:complete len:105 (-) Transcript_8237:149-463(-)